MNKISLVHGQRQTTHFQGKTAVNGRPQSGIRGKTELPIENCRSQENECDAKFVY